MKVVSAVDRKQNVPVAISCDRERGKGRHAIASDSCNSKSR